MIIIKELNLFDNNIYQKKTDEFKFNKRTDGNLIKSRKRVSEHGEVFTPKWMVKKMLAVPDIQKEIHDLHATFFEPSAGEGAFLVEILHQKLMYVDEISSKKNWTVNALWVLMSIYAIEYLEDNLIKARQKMIDILVEHYQSFFQQRLTANTEFYKSSKLIITLNIVQGNTLTCKKKNGDLIIFNDWKTINNDEVLRVPFTYESLLGIGGEQLDIFNSNNQLSLFESEYINNKSYAVVKVNKIYKEELN